VQELEGKLESVTTLLTTLTQRPLGQNGTNSIVSTNLLENHPRWGSTNATPHNGNLERSTTTVIIPNEDPDIIDRGIITIEAANDLLQRFISTLCNYFPFVALPPWTTAETLRHESPFLFLSIIASASSSNFPLQRRLAKEIHKYVASKMIVEGEKNMDLLQGILVHLAWYHFFLDQRKPRVSLFVQLCTLLVQDLGLDMHPHEPRTPAKYSGTDEVQSSQRSLAEKRALLGTYYVSASYVTLLPDSLTTTGLRRL
jgi:hypothetical protein